MSDTHYPPIVLDGIRKLAKELPLSTLRAGFDAKESYRGIPWEVLRDELYNRFQRIMDAKYGSPWEGKAERSAE